MGVVSPPGFCLGSVPPPGAGAFVSNPIGNFVPTPLAPPSPSLSLPPPPLLSFDTLLLKLYMYVDMLGAATHVSPPSCCLYSIPYKLFVLYTLPILNMMCIHSCKAMNFRLATWNTHGLLGCTSLGIHRAHRRKANGVKRFLTQHHIVCLQEIHCGELEAMAFAKTWGHSHAIFTSFFCLRNCGGVAICLSRSFLAGCLLCFMFDICPGRIAGVCLVFYDMVLVVICMHNAPDWNKDTRSQHFRNTRSCIPAQLRAASFVVGDFNFGFDTTKVTDGHIDVSVSDYRKLLASLWDSHFHDFIEVEQDSPTFMREGCIYEPA